MQWLSDNGSIFAAHRTIEIALALNLVPCFTPVESPESNGMAEAFVKTFKRDYVRVSRYRMPLPHLPSSIAGWRTTTPSTPIPGWAIAHPGSTSFPNPLRVRFNGVNSTLIVAITRVASPGGSPGNQLHHAIEQRRRQRRQTGFARHVVQQAGNPLAQEPLLPAPHAWCGDPGPALDLGAPQPSAVARMIRARQTCFCELLRPATTATNRSRSTALSSKLIPSRIQHLSHKSGRNEIL